MKKILFIISFFFLQNAFAVPRPREVSNCYSIWQHLDRTMTTCPLPDPSNCVAFHVTLTRTLGSVDDDGTEVYHCKLSGSSDFGQVSALFVQLRAYGRPEPLATSSAAVTPTSSNFSYDILDLATFDSYQYFQLYYRIGGVAPHAKAIYFTEFMPNGPTGGTYPAGASLPPAGSGDSSGGPRDERGPIACAADGSCPAGLTCNAANVCEATLDTSCPEGETATVDATGATVCVVSSGSGADGSSGPPSPGTNVGRITIPDQSNSNSGGGGMCQLNPKLSFDSLALNLGWIVLGIIALAGARKKKI